jgi:hypothetical protein
MSVSAIRTVTGESCRPSVAQRTPGDWQTEGQKLLAELNIARSKARQCGTQPFGATAPLT